MTVLPTSGSRPTALAAPTSSPPMSAPSGGTTRSTFCRDLPERAGVVAVPCSVFYDDPGPAERALVRWTFSKQDHVLQRRAERACGRPTCRPAEPSERPATRHPVSASSMFDWSGRHEQQGASSTIAAATKRVGEAERVGDQTTEQRTERHRPPRHQSIGAVDPSEQSVRRHALPQRHHDDVAQTTVTPPTTKKAPTTHGVRGEGRHTSMAADSRPSSRSG